MDKSLLEIRTHDGDGYQPLVDFGEWRVAMLRLLDGLRPPQTDSMERHTETDEVFVLLSGNGLLILGGNGAQIDGISSQVMEYHKVYNVKRNAWHTILLSRDATILLVENRETSRQNSEYITLSPEQCQLVREAAQRQHTHLWK